MGTGGIITRKRDGGNRTGPCSGSGTTRTFVGVRKAFTVIGCLYHCPIRVGAVFFVFIFGKRWPIGLSEVSG